jgi:hypothetical protein
MARRHTGEEQGEEGQEETGPGALLELWEQAQEGRVSKGLFSLYKTPDGGMLLAFRVEGAEEDQHLPVPAAMLRMLLSAAAGKGPLARIGAMAARMGGS